LSRQQFAWFFQALIRFLGFTFGPLDAAGGDKLAASAPSGCSPQQVRQEEMEKRFCRCFFDS
jgi:hypothetical protein